MDPVVVIGNGVASVFAVESFRKHDRNTPIIIIGDEPYLAYYRIRLSSLIGETPDLEKLYIRSPEWYRELDVEVRLKEKVTGIDTYNKTIALQGGNTVPYSKLLIASGSSPFVPPIPGTGLSGVFSIRSLDDVKQFNDFIEGKAFGAVIGGGPLGLEAAWALAKKGKKVHVIEGAPHILFKLLDETAAEILTDLAKNVNINFIVNGQLNEVTGNGQVSELHLGDGNKIAAEFIVFATGVRPNIKFVANTPIQTARGIIVNEFMQTSVEDVYAAGDVAEYKGQVYGIWPVAKEQGATAGLNMAGIKTSYSEVVPSNYLKVFEIEVFSAGDLCKDVPNADTIKVLDREKCIYKAVFFKGGSPVGAILLGDTKPAVKISKAIKAGVKVPESIIKAGDFESFLNECNKI